MVASKDSLNVPGSGAGCAPDGTGEGAKLVVRDVRPEGYHILRLNRSSKKNALNRAMYSALVAGLQAGEDDLSIAAHVLLGQPGVFSAGHDIADFATAVLKAGAQDVSGRDLADSVLSASVLAFIRLLPRLNKPLIAGVDGLAVGVGTTVLFHCDLVFATQRSRFSTPFVDLGLVPEAGSSLLGPARLGYLGAFELLVAGRVVDADWMLQAGAVNTIVASDDLETVACDAAHQLAAKPREAMLASKLLMQADRQTLIDQTEREIDVFAKHLASPEAMRAFQASLGVQASPNGQARG
ncbi:MAG: enoyl-CoA hydratase-related protein [Pseudomonadota bacterium]